MTINLAILPGDGIGPEVLEAALKVLDQTAAKFDVSLNLNEKLIGGASFDKYQTPLTDDTLQACYDSDAVLLGAVGGYNWESLDHHLKPEAALLKLRKSLELFANIRPVKVYSSLIDSSSLKQDVLDGTNFVVVRELTGGIYFGSPRGFNKEKGWNTMEYSKKEVERIARAAFDIALKRKRKVISVDKANVLECSQFWRKIVHEVQNEYRDVELQDMYVDNAAMQIIRNPKQFDVIVTSNLFGDIISDIAGTITGSLGMLPSASLGETHALYEPIHGSAPDIAGQNKANPIAAITSVAMMFKHSFNMTTAADMIEESVERTLLHGYRTEDIYSEGCELVSTGGMTDSIMRNFEEIYYETMTLEKVS